MSYESIPYYLKERTCWICWRVEQRDDEEAKVPVNPHTGSYASTTDEETWASFSEATATHDGDEIETAGVGFVFRPNDTVVGVDLDDCRNPETGEPTPEADEIISRLDSWTEVSQSGTGYHVFVGGFVPDGGNRGDIDDVSHIEMYDESRFFAMTGDHVSNTPETVENRVQVVRELHDEYVADDEPPANSGQSVATERPSVSLDDSDLIEKAKNAKNGDKFRRLWRGDISAYGNDHSRARQAFANLLAYWTGGDENRMLDLFKQSGLYRGSDDERTFTNYEIPNALKGRTDFYDPQAQTARADGGLQAQSTAHMAPSPNGGTLTPATVKQYAGLGPEESIADLNDRQRAAFVWQSIKNSDNVHVRLNRDNDELWSYDEETGTWSPNGERALRQAARRALEPQFYGGNVLEELKNQVRADPSVEVWGETFGLEAGKLAVKNGLLDLEKAHNGDDDSLRDLKPEDYALNRLPVEYNPEADTSTWYGFVGDVVETPMIQTLQEYVGYCLHRDSLYERALLMVGEGANGKSTFLNTIEAMLGDDNTTSVSPFDFGNKPALARMHGSMANISVELEGGALRGQNLSNFKNLTGHDSIQAKRLYENPFSFKYDGGMLFATNEVPDVPVSDDDTAFWRRWLIVHFDNHFPENSSKRDPTLGDRLTEPENLSAVLNWAIEGWGRLMENNQFSNAPGSRTTRQQWQSWGDSVDYFLSNVATRDENAPNISTTEAWEVYRQWCQENGYDSVGQHSFTNAAKDKMLGYTSSVRTDRHNTPRRGYKLFGTVDGEADPVDVFEAQDDNDNDDDTRNSGLGDYDGDDDRDGDRDSSATDESDEETTTEGGKEAKSQRNPEGETGENSSVDDENAESGDSASTWVQLLADIQRHYSAGDEINPDEFANRIDRDVSNLYVKKGLEELAEQGTIEKIDGGKYRA